MVAKVWTPSFSFPWPLPAMLQCVQVPGDWCQEHQPSWISLITIRCFFLLLKLLLCVFLCPADTAGPTFLFARERRVAVFIGSGVKPPPLSLLSSRPHCLCFWVVSTPVIILLPRGTWGGLPACLRGAGRQRHLGTRAGAGGHGSRQAAGFGNPAGGTSRGQGCQKQTALRHCLAWPPAREQPDHLHLWKAHLPPSLLRADSGCFCLEKALLENASYKSHLGSTGGKLGPPFTFTECLFLLLHYYGKKSHWKLPVPPLLGTSSCLFL